MLDDRFYAFLFLSAVALALLLSLWAPRAGSFAAGAMIGVFWERYRGVGGDLVPDDAPDA